MFVRTWDVLILLQDGDKNSKNLCQKTGTYPDKELEGDASLAKLPLVGFLFNIQWHNPVVQVSEPMITGMIMKLSNWIPTW